MARKKRGRRSPKITTLARSGIAALIGLSPVIESGIRRLPSGDFKGFGDEVMESYTGFDQTGVFAVQRLARGYVPLIGAVAFYKATGWLFKRLRV